MLIFVTRCFITNYAEVPECEVLGQCVGGGHAVDDGGEDGAVEELHHGEHLQEGLVEDFALDNLGQGWRQPDNIGLYIVLKSSSHICFSKFFSYNSHM